MSFEFSYNNSLQNKVQEYIQHSEKEWVHLSQIEDDIFFTIRSWYSKNEDQIIAELESHSRFDQLRSISETKRILASLFREIITIDLVDDKWANKNYIITHVADSLSTDVFYEVESQFYK